MALKEPDMNSPQCNWGLRYTYVFSSSEGAEYVALSGLNFRFGYATPGSAPEPLTYSGVFPNQMLTSLGYAGGYSYIATS
jgi:hypothetical protein